MAALIRPAARGRLASILGAALPAGAAVALLVAAADAQEKPAATGLPGGASSLTEGHGDWTVTCQALPAAGERPAGKACALSQRQVSREGQTVFAVELRPTAEGGASGAMILPFGVAVRQSVILKVGAVPLGEPLAFTTCLPAGCLVPLALGRDAVAALTGGKAATITAPTLDAAPVELTLSLDGFGPAIARVRTLGQ